MCDRSKGLVTRYRKGQVLLHNGVGVQIMLFLQSGNSFHEKWLGSTFFKLAVHLSLQFPRSRVSGLWVERDKKSEV